MRRADLPSVVATLRETAAELERTGENAWDLTRDWAPGLRSGALTGSRSSGAPSDPTGTAAAAPEPDPHAVYRTRLLAAHHAAIDLLATLYAVDPRPRPRLCAWMAEVGHSEPAPRTINGRPASRWVYDAWNTTGRFPSLDERRRRAAGLRAVATPDPGPEAA